MEQGNLLSDAALQQVRQVVRQVLGDVRGNRADGGFTLIKGPEVFIFKAEAAIPARSSTTPGKLADVPLYKIDRDGPTLEQLFLHDGTTANTRDVYNVTETEIAEGDYAIAWRDKLGTWLTVPIASNKRYGMTQTGGIAAATLSAGKITPGSATVDEYRHDGSDYEDSTVDVTVYNPWPDAILADRLISFSLDQDGLLTIDAEACNAFVEET